MLINEIEPVSNHDSNCWIIAKITCINTGQAIHRLPDVVGYMPRSQSNETMNMFDDGDWFYIFKSFENTPPCLIK